MYNTKQLRKAKEIIIGTLKIKFDKGIQLRDRETSIKSLLAVENKTADMAKKVCKTNKYKHTTVWVNRDIRALMKNGTDFYHVLEHENYNRIVDTK